MRENLMHDKKVWFIARVQLIITVLMYTMNLLYLDKNILTLFTLFTILSGITYLYYFLTKRFDQWSAISLLLVSIDCGYYVFSGGNRGAGILWSLIVPFLAMYLRGYKTGSIISIVYLSALLVMVAIAYLMNVVLPYSNTFLFVFFTVNISVLVLLYKIDRGRSLIQEDYDRVENLFIHATDLLFIGDVRGFFLTVNPACTEVLGWEKEELLDKPFMDFIHPDDREQSLQNNKTLRQINGVGYTVLENRFLCNDGSYKWLSWRMVVDPHKKLVYAIARDITENKKQEKELQERALFQSIIMEESAEFINSTPEDLEEKINELLYRVGQFLGCDRAYLIRLNKDEAAEMAIYEWCREGFLSFGNSMKMNGYSLDTVVRSFILKLDLLYIPRLDQFKDQSNWLRDLYRREQVETLLLLPLVKNGQNVAVIGFDTIGHTREISADLIELLKVLAQLITEVLMKNEVDLSFREAAGKLDDLNKTKDKLFSIIAHDLRSPLSTIIGFTEMMTDSTSGYSISTMQDYAKLLNQVAMNTFDLLENLLDWSRLQRGLLKPERVDVLVNDLVKCAIGPYEQKAASKNMLVNIRIEAGLKAAVDRRMLETVIRNLYTNALKFTPEGGVITLKAETTPENRLLLCVSDSGIGIPKPLLPLLFGANEDKNRQGLGGERSSGLGLMLCKEFVDLHQGTIHVETAENKGSTFCINLPCLISGSI